MQFPESWLRELINPDLSTSMISDKLTMAGLEVENVATVAPPFDNVVVAQVLEVAPHPNADRLKVCQVDVGQVTPLQIVCGANNVAVGIKVACALVGAVLPAAKAGVAPLTIKLSRLRDVESQGMLCSARELHLPLNNTVDGLLILDQQAQVGQSLRQYLALDDAVLTLKLTPNRADCLSILGVAREIAALTDAPLMMPNKTHIVPSLSETFPVKISASDLCGRFAGRIIRHVNARAQTPAWMVRRLERSGQHSISALVDISNYVMLEMGQPTHLFDLDKIQGGLEIRWARAGESVKLLNERTVTLSSDQGVLASDQGVAALAGIMGGDHTAITLDTQHVFLEAAFWYPDAIRGRARQLNIASEAAHRFERGVDFAATVNCLEYMTALIVEICGGAVGPIDDQIIQLPARSPVSMRLSRAKKVLGIPLDQQTVATIFTRLGFKYTVAQDVFSVTPPSFRFDLEIEEDLIEEVARIYGFDNIPAHPPVAEQCMLPTHEARRSMHQLRHALAARDYQEVINFSFVAKNWEQELLANADPIQLLNPIASQLAVMRSSLLPGLLENIRYNVNRKNNRVRVFEIGTTFQRDPVQQDSVETVAHVAQTSKIAAAAYGCALPEQWGSANRLVDYFDIKGDIEALIQPLNSHRFTFIRYHYPLFHPGRSAQLQLDGHAIGYLGELHPRWQQLFELPHPPVLFEVNLSALTEVGLPAYQEVSKFPVVVRDLALVVSKDVLVQSILATMRAASANFAQLIRDIRLFDMFQPEQANAYMGSDEKSLAFRIILQDNESTLQDDQVESMVRVLLDSVKQAYGARLRS
jgi:phenylalanyl-tRNA synthetase beta chain